VGRTVVGTGIQSHPSGIAAIPVEMTKMANSRADQTSERKGGKTLEF
jgi:hypothetical protein